MPALTQDNALVWLHGRRVGLVGDGAFSASSGMLVDSQLVGSKRGNAVFQLAAGNNGAGGIAFTAAASGDVLLFALDLTTPATSRRASSRCSRLAARSSRFRPQT
jgi:hypothetical protein